LALLAFDGKAGTFAEVDEDDEDDVDDGGARH
jgi:hypothetical protein